MKVLEFFFILCYNADDVYYLYHIGGELPMEMRMGRNAKRALGMAVALHLMLPACVVWANENAGGVHRFKPNR